MMYLSQYVLFLLTASIHVNAAPIEKVIELNQRSLTDSRNSNTAPAPPPARPLHSGDNRSSALSKVTEQWVQAMIAANNQATNPPQVRNLAEPAPGQRPRHHFAPFAWKGASVNPPASPAPEQAPPSVAFPTVRQFVEAAEQDGVVPRNFLGILNDITGGVLGAATNIGSRVATGVANRVVDRVAEGVANTVDTATGIASDVVNGVANGGFDPYPYDGVGVGPVGVGGVAGRVVDRVAQGVANTVDTATSIASGAAASVPAAVGFGPANTFGPPAPMNSGFGAGITNSLTARFISNFLNTPGESITGRAIRAAATTLSTSESISARFLGNVMATMTNLFLPATVIGAGVGAAPGFFLDEPNAVIGSNFAPGQENPSFNLVPDTRFAVPRQPRRQRPFLPIPPPPPPPPMLMNAPFGANPMRMQPLFSARRQGVRPQSPSWPFASQPQSSWQSTTQRRQTVPISSLTESPRPEQVVSGSAPETPSHSIFSHPAVGLPSVQNGVSSPRSRNLRERDMRPLSRD